MSWAEKPRIALRRVNGTVSAGRAQIPVSVPPRRVLLLSLAAICIVIAALVTFTEWTDRQRRLAGAFNQASALARVLEEQMANLFHGADQALLGIAEGLRGRPAIGVHDPDFEDSLRRRVENLPAVRALFVIGADGFITQDSDRGTPRRNLADRRYFMVHRDGLAQGLFIDDPLVSRSTGEWFVALSRRLEGPDGKFAGVVAAAVDISYFENFYAELGLRTDDVITLATKETILVARQPASEDRIGERLVQGEGRSILERMLEAGPVGVFEAESAIDGVRRLFAYRVLPEHPLVVLVGLSRDGVLAPWRQSALVAGLATASAIGISAFLWCLAVHYARRDAEAQAALAQTAKLEAIGRTTSGVAHDFNNLLTAMGGALRLLGKRLQDDEHAAKIVEQGLISLEQGRNLIAQLLNITRQDVKMVEVDINTALSSMVTLLNSVATPKARVEIDLAPDLHHCRVDPSRLGAAILNLVMNASDAMPRDRGTTGLIVISSSNDPGDSPDASFVRVTVRDNGMGMSPEVRRRALEPFFTTKGKRGTGLGLSQVHTFVKDMGGSMEIESEEGRGTAVHMRFPRAERSEETSALPQENQ